MILQQGAQTMRRSDGLVHLYSMSIMKTAYNYMNIMSLLLRVYGTTCKSLVWLHTKIEQLRTLVSQVPILIIIFVAECS